MLRFLADENFNSAIVRGALRRLPSLDVVTVQEVGLSGAPDPVVLDWAAKNDRILITHDVSTIPEFVRLRTESGERVRGVVEVTATASIAHAIDDLLLLAQCSLDGEWEGQIVYVPL